VQARRPRFESSKEERRLATERFIDAALGGDINALMEVLAPDVTLWTDSGGKVRAPRRVIEGADKVSRWLSAVAGQPYAGVEPKDMTLQTLELNGVPGIVIYGPAGPIAAFVVDTADDGLVRTVHVVANPDKLRALAEGRELPF
jgi:RNA polymerase sigma-70 factor (ECF subfamily)